MSDPDYIPVITRLPEALEDEREEREAAEAELARVAAERQAKDEAYAAERKAEQDAVEQAGYEADRKRLAEEK